MKESLLYRIVKPITNLFVFIVFHPKKEGKDNLKNNNILLAGTHTSNLDSILLMYSVKKPIHFLAKIELFKGIKGIIFNNMGLIPVDRSKHNPESVNKAVSYLKDNKLVLVFPEGTTEKGNGLLPFKKGACRIAKEADVLIVPFVITGKYTPFINKLKIKFLEPYKVSDDIDKSTEELRNIIKGEL